MTFTVWDRDVKNNCEGGDEMEKHSDQMEDGFC